MKTLDFTPTTIVISDSGGKDSTAASVLVRKLFPEVPTIIHHQFIYEDWPGTVGHVEKIASLLNLPLVTERASYFGYECSSCGHHWLYYIPHTLCEKCHQRTGVVITVVDRLLDLMKWRKKWPSNSIRFCTSYLKRDLFDKWARRNKLMLGERPVLVTGERWLESRNRAKLVYQQPRASIPWLLNWRPILHYRRIDAFTACRDAGMPIHPCYIQQGMTEEEMFTVNVEGGPRMSCRMCFFLSPEQMALNAQMPDQKEFFQEFLDFEKETGFTYNPKWGIQAVIDGTHLIPPGQATMELRCD